MKYPPTAKLKNNKKFSILADHLGTPTSMHNAEGEQVWERSLDTFGKVITGDNNSCPFMYQGQYYDSEIELAYNRFRYYDPEDGRYISVDPIGLDSGEDNFYAYVPDSNCYVDILGLSYNQEKNRRNNGQFGKKRGPKSNKKQKGAANQGLLDSAARGREAHRNYKNALPGNYDFEVQLDNGKRVDAIDFESNTVKELKPNTKSGISKGKKQLDGYVNQLESQTGEKWTGYLDTYKP